MIGQPINPESQPALKHEEAFLCFPAGKVNSNENTAQNHFVFVGLFGHITGTSAHCFCVFPTEGHSSDVSRGECTLGYVGGGGGELERDRTLSDRHVQHPSPGPPLGEQEMRCAEEGLGEKGMEAEQEGKERVHWRGEQSYFRRYIGGEEERTWWRGGGEEGRKWWREENMVERRREGISCMERRRDSRGIERRRGGEGKRN